MFISLRTSYVLVIAALLFAVSFLSAYAATLSVSPGTGVYTAGSTFTVRVAINTNGKAVNAAEGALSFNPREVSVVSVSRAASIFNLWTLEPTFSNSAGTVSFGGGSPSGYTGSSGTIMTITMRALNAGSPKLTFTSGSVLAADGLGTNILSNMQSGTYTITAAAAQPEPEQVYVPPPNTPGAPVIDSSTHPDPDEWYKSTTAELSWSVPAGITAVRTLLDESRSTIPTKVYETPINDLTIEDLDEGVSYLHIQFQNNEGWGTVTHYRLAVDTTPPESFEIRTAEGETVGEQALIFDADDAVSGISHYMVQIDGGEPERFVDESGEGRYVLPPLTPGYHTIIVEAVDYAGNSLVATHSFDIIAFDRPVFTDYPTRINEEVIPVITGQTRPNAEVTIRLGQIGSEPVETVVLSDETGMFTFIPAGRLSRGVYELSAVAVDEFGAQSEMSEVARIIVQPPGYVRIGSTAVSVLSILVPLIALIALLGFTAWYTWFRYLAARRKIIKEVREAEQTLAKEFDEIVDTLHTHGEKLKKAKRGKLTKSETAFMSAFTENLDAARKRIRKEISDIDDIVE